MKLTILDSFACLYFWSISFYVILLPGCEADVQACYIGSLTSLPLGSRVAAYDDCASHISGCSATYESSTSVVAYVLSLKSSAGSNPASDKQSVVLNIDETRLSSLLSSTNVVFVLSSADPISWDIRTTTLLAQPRILVSRQSTVNSPAQVEVRTEDDLPVDQHDLLDWVSQKHPVATFAEVTDANRINVIIKQESHVNNNKTCVISADWKQNEVSAVFVQEKLIRGCILPKNSEQAAKEVYVIERHEGEEDVATPTVTVNLRTVRQDTREHNIVLVLKSSGSPVLWHVRGTSITGSLDIQSNSKVINDDEIFDSVTTVLASLDHSGEDLVKYLEKQYGGLVQYLSVDAVNRVEITLEAPDVPKPPNFLFQDSAVPEGNSLLEHIVHTQCYDTSMLVAISLSTLGKYSMSKNDIHLSDSDCNATTNDTHLIFKADLGKCGMRLKSTKKENVYVNEVHFDPEKGGDKEVGSGMLPDDEDASDRRRPSVSEVQCRYPKVVVQDQGLTQQQDSPITYHVCSSAKCSGKVLQFSVGTIYDDANLLATVRSCAVSSLDGTVVDHYIIKNGCAPPGSVLITRNGNETVRINSLAITDTIKVYEVTCEVAICSPVKTAKHSQCPNRDTKMPCTLQERVETEFGTTYTIHLQPNHILGNTEKTPVFDNQNANEITAVTESTTTIVINGLTTLQVVGISLAAFLMGIFFVAAIWCIHMHTAIPRETQEQSTSSQPPPYQPNGYAGYRQVPNGQTSNGYGCNNGHVTGFGPTINPNGIPMNGMMNSADLAMV